MLIIIMLQHCSRIILLIESLLFYCIDVIIIKIEYVIGIGSLLQMNWDEMIRAWEIEQGKLNVL